MAKQKKVERCIYLRGGSYAVVKRNKWSTFETLEDARVFRDKVEVEQTEKPQGGPFADFIRKQYIPLYVANMKENTRASLLRRIRHDFIPEFGSKKIAEITHLNVLEFQKSLVDRNLSPSTVNTELTILKIMMSKAKDLGLCTSNPCDNVRGIKVIAKDRVVLTEAGILELFQKIDHPYRYAIALAGFAGAREGEVMGFKWEDFDLSDHSTISFVRQINSAGHIDELKSTGSKTTVPMMSILRDILRKWKEESPGKGWLFRDKKEKQSSKTLGNWWCDTRIPLGLGPTTPKGRDGMRFHDFRHSFCTNVVQRNPPFKVAQKICRHARVEMTLAIYAHLHPEAMEEVYEWHF